MVQTASTSEADQSHVPGTTAVRVLGVLLILQGSLRLLAAMGGVLQAATAVIPNYVVFTFTVTMLTALALLAISVGILLVRRDHAGRVFGLVVCSIALAYQLFALGYNLANLYAFVQSPRSLGLLFWLLQPLNIVLFLVGIILIARWHPPREIERLGRIFD